MRVRPNPTRASANFASIARAAAERWPELSIQWEKPDAPVDG